MAEKAGYKGVSNLEDFARAYAPTAKRITQPVTLKESLGLVRYLETSSDVDFPKETAEIGWMAKCFQVSINSTLLENSKNGQAGLLKESGCRAILKAVAAQDKEDLKPELLRCSCGTPIKAVQLAARSAADVLFGPLWPVAARQSDGAIVGHSEFGPTVIGADRTSSNGGTLRIIAAGRELDLPDGTPSYRVWHENGIPSFARFADVKLCKSLNIPEIRRWNELGEFEGQHVVASDEFKCFPPNSYFVGGVAHDKVSVNVDLLDI